MIRHHLHRSPHGPVVAVAADQQSVNARRLLKHVEAILNPFVVEAVSGDLNTNEGAWRTYLVSGRGSRE